MKTISSKAKSIETPSDEVKVGHEETSEYNFTSEDTHESHINHENLESWEKITQHIKENIFFR